ncbi:MAG: SMP-30/gluconolactonase/LRE family protein [Neorhizobium sp.]|jgi:sugar lactone lactonase YvrE|nr:SMP-30/gluconolactonase/LRE family protein [Neorhizobium sp.]
MAETHQFDGLILSPSLCELGEGASFEAETGTLWWFDILGKALHEMHLATGREIIHRLSVMGSVVARIDATRQLIASDQGLFIRERSTNVLTPYAPLEEDKPGNRSNDGRVHPSGSLWISTMGLKAEDGAGGIYHVSGTTVTRIFAGISIPNSICFSPDGETGYYVDTKKNLMMRVPLDRDSGLPTGAGSVFVDGSSEPGGIDGSICDGAGTVWNARWGEGAVDHYDRSGKRLARYLLPAKRTTCPVYLGNGRLGITSSWEGLDEKGRADDRLAGSTFEISVPIKADAEPAFLL